MQSQTEWQLPNPSTWEVAAATTKSPPLFPPKVIGSSDLYSEFQDSAVRPFLKEKPNSKLFNGNLGYRVRSCLNNKPNQPNKKAQKGLEMCSAYPTCMRPQVQSPELHELGMVGYMCDLST